ncbi:hypothetical protein [Salinicola aestuarinus]|uniref:hypothetical protein n=1 Tax=Salinicola aestuarinus TaxID=1949082 RepID=UPI000DA1B318|nr:hypothetical protein [Salinicola aestuarinus]
MENWQTSAQEMTALGIALCALIPLYRQLRHPVVGTIMVACLVAGFASIPLPSSMDLTLAVILLGSVVMANRRRRLTAWLTPNDSATSNAAGEIALEVAAHPVTHRLQVFHLSRWFEAILLDPANPALREGETVYLIRHDGTRAWVSRVRSRTQSSASVKRWRLDLGHS